MSTAVTSICNRCHQRIVGIKHKFEGKEYCETCYQALMQELQEQEQQKVALYSYISDLFGVTECPEYVIRGIEKAIKTGKKISGIKGTVYWYYLIEGHSLNNIGEIPLVVASEYENAKRHMERAKQITRLNEQVDLRDIPPNNVRIQSNRHIKKWKPNYKMEDL